MAPVKPLQWNLNIAMQVELESEIHKKFHTVSIRFSSRFFATAKMTNHVWNYKIEDFLGREFYSDECKGNKMINRI